MTSRCDIVLQASKDGYYSGSNEFSSVTKENNQWQPWNSVITIHLKRIKNPIPLVAKKVLTGYSNAQALPAEKSGYDVEVGDWVVPHGKGKIADIIFQIEGRATSAQRLYDAKLKMYFSHPGDGLVVYEPDMIDRRSELKVPYLAPASGYLPSKVWRKARLPGPSTGPERDIDVIVDDLKKTENFFLRIRSILDENGKIVSANYCKIQGGFSWNASGMVKFQYYYNPNANDLNLEFDISKNLMITNKGFEILNP